MACISRSEEDMGDEWDPSYGREGWGVGDRGIKGKGDLCSIAILPVKTVRLRDAAYDLRLRIIREAVRLTIANAKLHKSR